METQIGWRAEAAIRPAWLEHDARPHLNIVRYAAAVLDGVVIVAASVACSIGYSRLSFGSVDVLSRHLGAGLLLAATFVALLSAQGAYRPNELVRIRKQALRIALYGSGSLGFLVLIAFLFKISDDFSRGTLLAFLILCPVSLIAVRLFWARWIPAATSRGFVRPRRILLICTADYPIADLREQMVHTGAVIAHVLSFPQNETAARWMEKLSTGIARGADEVLVAFSNAELPSARDLLDELRALPMPVKVVLDPMVAGLLAHPATKIGRVAAIEVQHEPLSAVARCLKRSFDIALALTALLTLFPIFILTAIAIKLESPGPVFFVQRRRGCNDVAFGVVKFRSMRVMEDGSSVAQATRNDARVTRVGAVIRSTSIDELPQLWNVLRGQMSIVGPRPHALVHDDHYDRMIARYAFRRNVKPGITGWAQVNGLRGETPSIDSMEERVAHDLWYIHNWSFWLDMKIVIQTAISLARNANAY
jgi:putative colanic acid biosysnthesis UDP-glucose lipid carrier transferase